MPTASQYHLTHQELTEAIIKTVGVHEGKWQLMITFGFAAFNGGPNENEIMPSGIVGVQKVGITEASAGSPAGLVVDAAKVNPASRPPKRTKA